MTPPTAHRERRSPCRARHSTGRHGDRCGSTANAGSEEPVVSRRSRRARPATVRSINTASMRLAEIGKPAAPAQPPTTVTPAQPVVQQQYCRYTATQVEHRRHPSGSQPPAAAACAKYCCSASTAPLVLIRSEEPIAAPRAAKSMADTVWKRRRASWRPA